MLADNDPGMTMETGVGGLVPAQESTVMDPYEQLVEELVPAEKDDGLLLEAEQVIPKVEQERTIGTTGQDVVPATGSEVEDPCERLVEDGLPDGTRRLEPTVEPCSTEVDEVNVIKKILVNIGKVDDLDLETQKVMMMVGEPRSPWWRRKELG